MIQVFADNAELALLSHGLDEHELLRSNCGTMRSRHDSEAVPAAPIASCATSNDMAEFVLDPDFDSNGGGNSNQ